MLEKKMPTFTELSEFASVSAGGEVLFATDDFFAPCENMIADTEPVFIAEKYTEFGKWMDGWETRRKRIPGHDWCIIKLATKCVIRGLLVDTAFFTGNYAPKFSMQAANLTLEDEALIPKRNTSRIGSSCSKSELEKMKQLKSDEWDEIVPITCLQSGYEETRMNFQKVLSDEAWTHIRINIYPDGGIARLRVFGEARPKTPLPGQLVDLMSLLTGASCQAYSNAHYGHPRNMMKPYRSESMADGWETARRLDRPQIIEAKEDGTLKIPGEEWAIFKLGFPGFIEKICVDTAHFKGNFPDSVKIEGAYWPHDDCPTGSDVPWQIILKPSKLSAHKEYYYDCDDNSLILRPNKFTHLKVTIAPDGGISRIRAFGYTSTKAIA